MKPERTTFAILNENKKVVNTIVASKAFCDANPDLVGNAPVETTGKDCKIGDIYDPKTKTFSAPE